MAVTVSLGGLPTIPDMSYDFAIMPKSFPRTFPFSSNTGFPWRSNVMRIILLPDNLNRYARIMMRLLGVSPSTLKPCLS